MRPPLSRGAPHSCIAAEGRMYRRREIRDTASGGEMAALVAGAATRISSHLRIRTGAGASLLGHGSRRRATSSPCGGSRGGVPGVGAGCGWGIGVGCGWGWGIGEGWGRTGSNGGGRGGSPGRVGSLGFGMVTAYSFLSSPAIPKPAATRLPRRVRLAQTDFAHTRKPARAGHRPA